MAFEFFFGLLGLISSDSKSRHKSRLESEWRLPTPLNANMFRDGPLKSPMSSSTFGGKSSSSSSSGLGGLGGTGSQSNLTSTSNDQKQRPIFSTTGTLAAANSGSVSEGLFSSTSSSSASSIASSGSNLTTNSTSAFIKPGEHTKKYEFRLNLIGEKGGAGNNAGNLGGKVLDGADLLSGLGKGGSGGGAGTATTTSSGSSADLISDGQQEANSGGGANIGDGEEPSMGSSSGSVSRGQQLRKLYCLIVCACLWVFVVRLIVGLLVEKSLLTLDFYYLGAFKIHFLIPAMCLAIQAAAVSTLFIRNNDETNWLVPFYSSKDYLIRSRSNFKPKMEDYTKRVNVSIVLALVLAMVSSISTSAYLIHCVSASDIFQASAMSSSSSSAAAVALSKSSHDQALAPTQYETLGAASAPAAASTTIQPSSSQASAAAASSTMSTIVSLQRQATPSNASSLGEMETLADVAAGGGSRMERIALISLLAMDVLWAVYSTYICFLVSFYFNLICSIMKSRFHGISKIIEDLAESNTTKTTNQARKITTLYLEHNEACELLDESNDFWQYLIFFTYFTYIPAYCYCLYNLFFVDFEAWPSFITWVIHTHTGFIILLISFSAAGVSTEAHAPYTSLHTLSLIQLPLDVEVNIATFLHRVRGLTIGYSCYDLFAITNASMSNTAAACASYFLIVADFSRSSVFTLAQINNTAGGAAGAAAAVGAAATTAAPVG